MKKIFNYTLRALLLGYLGLSFQLPALAQFEQAQRIEIPVNSSFNESYDVFSLGENGALSVVRRNEFTGTRNEYWHFTRYDTDLNPLWTRPYKLDYRYVPIMAYQSDYYIYWLFAEPDTDHFLFLQLDLARGELDVHKGDLLSGVDVHQFKVIGSKALVAGYYHNRPVVLVHSFFDHTTRVLPGLYERNTEINNVDINESEGMINVITYAYRKRSCQFNIKTYNYDGKLLKSTVLSNDRNSFISGQIVPLNVDDSYLIGNYSVGCTPFSQGLFITHIQDNEPSDPQFIEFSELQNFFNYMKPKRKQRMLDRIGKRKSLGKENRFRYRLLVHPLIQTEDEIILVAEVYYPNYRSSTPLMTNGLNRAYTRSMDGFRYTHAIVCGFDRDGRYKWDNSFAIKDLVSYELQEMVQLSRVDDYFVLAYPQEGNIHTEVIHREKVVVENEKYQLESKNDTEKVLFNDNANLAAWYGKYFLAYGIQRVGTDRSLLTGTPREVFYINKLAYKTEDIGQPKPASTGEASTRKTSGSKR
ncbi:hypothetical protein GCM10027275_41140 [Rhabdobacter roseus]|uniref:DKNYY family protein n=1 Tax=Rhabdobacter roseus TaxID=1655419 RepID=A0A840U2L9_9BACT|nr:hypothetical protein [Rhabdobacter roseus]MBB5286089.1 hypothetical protein [Rhabdobacter roseus]